MTNYLFYDTEGTGTSKHFDQVLQFAAIVTDENFKELDSIDIRSKLLPHVVPHPVALLVTGIDPFSINEAPFTPFEFAKNVHDYLKKWAPVIYTGQNILNYDEEILRTMFYTNLLDPYPTSSQGCQRLDTVPMLRFVHTVDPTVFKTHTTDEGKISFKLDKVATLNGFEGHNAHDALGDVRATIFMTKLIKDRRPDLFAMAMANTHATHNHNLLSENRVVHQMTYFGKPEVQVLTRVGQHPENAKQVVAFNLAHDPSPWIDATAEQIAASMMKAGSIEGVDPELVSPERPFQIIKTNGQPCIFKADTDLLKPTHPVDVGTMVMRLEMIAKAPNFGDRIAQAMRIRSETWNKNDGTKQVEQLLYSGFASNSDKKLMTTLHNLKTWEERAEVIGQFKDKRFQQLGERLLLTYAPSNMASPARARIFERALIERRLLADTGVSTTLRSALKDGQDLLREPSDYVKNIPDWEPRLRHINKWMEMRITQSEKRVEELVGKNAQKENIFVKPERSQSDARQRQGR